MEQAGHPIQVVVRRTGLSADVLRAWERRYRVVVPGRADSGRRLYTDDDIRRLVALRQAISGGRAISALVDLPTEALEALVAEDATKSVPAAQLRRGRPPTVSRASLHGSEHDAVSALVEQAMQSVNALDAAALHETLRVAAIALSLPHLIHHVLVPLLHRIGKDWVDGTLRPGHEHFASEILRVFIAGLPSGSVSPHAPRFLATTPAGQRHEFGAFLASVVATSAGWASTYLGPDLPATEIAAAATRLGVRAIGLSVVHPVGDDRLVDELGGLRDALPGTIAIIAGGSGLAPIETKIETRGIYVARELVALNSILDQLAGEPAP